MDPERDHADSFRIATNITLTQLRQLSEEELVRRYDWAITLPIPNGRDGTFLSPNDYLRELDRVYQVMTQQ